MIRKEREDRETRQPTQLNKEEDLIIKDLENKLKPRALNPKTWPRP